MVTIIAIVLVIGIVIVVFRNPRMKTIQMTLDEDLLAAVDRMVRKLKTTRSAFTRKALSDALQKLNVSRLEQKHQRGYTQHPVAKDEFSVWESEQEWGSE